ncbi:MAG: hypothetical protein EOO75_19270, partial [Myxococcales bacterium]
MLLSFMTPPVKLAEALIGVSAAFSLVMKSVGEDEVQEAAAPPSTEMVWGESKLMATRCWMTPLLSSKAIVVSPEKPLIALSMSRPVFLPVRFAGAGTALLALLAAFSCSA